MAKRKATGLGERLRRSAHLAGLTGERLAERLGVSPAAVWAWWAGRNEPAADLLAAYARETDVSLSWLIEGPALPEETVHFLTEAAAPPPAWASLTPRQQSAILNLIDALDAENRRLRHG